MLYEYGPRSEGNTFKHSLVISRRSVYSISVIWYNGTNFFILPATKRFLPLKQLSQTWRPAENSGCGFIYEIDKYDTHIVIFKTCVLRILKHTSRAIYVYLYITPYGRKRFYVTPVTNKQRITRADCVCFWYTLEATLQIVE